ncbi:GNAT family N-acetyltransferase [Thalassotalea fusca]
MQVVIIKADKEDKKAIKRFYKHQHYSASFMGLDTAYIAKQQEEIVGAVIVSRIVEDNQQPLLHGLVVDRQYQRLGIAQLLLNQCQANFNEIRCFASPRLAEFYHKVKFVQGGETDLSPTLALRYQQYSCKQALWIFAPR